MAAAASAFGQEPVTGVHGVRAGALRSRDHGQDIQVGVGGCRPGQPDGGIALGDVRRVGVSVAEDTDGLDPEPMGRAHDAAGDLTAVGDQ